MKSLVKDTPNMLHILIGAERGGCERDSYVLAKYLRSFCHDIVVLGDRGPMSDDWESIGASVRHLRLMHLPRRQRVAALKKIFHGRKTDAVIIWHGMAELPPLLHSLPKQRAPIIIHGGNPAVGIRGWVDLRYLLMERRWPHPHDPIYVCCSHYVAASFERSAYLRRFRRYVIHNGVEHASNVVHKPRPADEQSGITVGMMARLDRIKDHPTLIRAMARVVKRFPNARLELAGDGERMSRLRRLVRGLRLEAHVTFLGSISNVYETISRWDVFAYAATPREGFGNAVAEALMCGLPTVVSDVAPLRELCGPDNTARFVPSFNADAMAAAIIELIENLSKRQRLAASARQWALHDLSAEVYATRHEQLLVSEQARFRNLEAGVV